MFKMNKKIKGSKNLNVPNLRFPEFKKSYYQTTISKLATIVGGGTPDTTVQEYWNGGIQWFTPSEIGKKKYADKSERTISREGLSNSSAKLLPINTILLSTRATIGESSIAKVECCTNQGFQSLIANEKIVCYEYMYYLVATLKKELIRKSCGSTFLEISANEVRKIKTFVPSLDEQSKVSSLLSLIDDRIATQIKIIEDLKKLKSAISNKYLYDKSWPKYKISEIATLGRGRVISSKEIGLQRNPMYPVYSSQTSNDGVMGYLDTYDFDGEYITWTTDGANAGTVFYRNGQFNCTNVCGTIKVGESFDAYFLSTILQTATARYVSTNLANPKLMNNTMASIVVRIPDIKIQKYWSSILRKMEEKLSIEATILLALQQQKQYFLAQMFI